eukprot:206152_1
MIGWCLAKREYIQRFMQSTDGSSIVGNEFALSWLHPKRWIELAAAILYFLPTKRASMLLMKENSNLADVYFCWYFVLSGGYNNHLLTKLPPTKTTYRRRINHTLKTDLARWIYDEMESELPSIPYITDRPRYKPQSTPFRHMEDEATADEWKVKQFGIATAFIADSECDVHARIQSDFGTLVCVERICPLRTIDATLLPHSAVPPNATRHRSTYTDEVCCPSTISPCNHGYNLRSTQEEKDDSMSSASEMDETLSITDQDGHYCIEWESNLYFGVEALRHETLMRNVYNYGKAYFDRHCNIDLIYAAFQISIRYRHFSMPMAHWDRAVNWWKGWFGVSRIQKAMKLIKQFRSAKGIFGANLFDTQNMTKNEIKEINEAKLWESVESIEEIGLYCRSFRMVMSFVGTALPVELGWRGWNRVNSFNRGHKSDRSKLKEMQYRWNLKALKEHGWLDL